MRIWGSQSIVLYICTAVQIEFVVKFEVKRKQTHIKQNNKHNNLLKQFITFFTCSYWKHSKKLSGVAKLICSTPCYVACSATGRQQKHNVFPQYAIMHVPEESLTSSKYIIFCAFWRVFQRTLCFTFKYVKTFKKFFKQNLIKLSTLYKNHLSNNLK